MDEILINVAKSQGIWTVISVTLISYMLKTQAKRENEYRKCISELHEKIDVISEIHNDLKDIKQLLYPTNTNKN